MKPVPFESDATIGSLRPIIRRNPLDCQEVEMVEAAWGLRARDPDAKPFKFIRAEGRTFPDHRCLVPASEFHVTNNGRRFRVTLDDGNFFYLAGIWQAPVGDWPLAHAVITIPANIDVLTYQERQGAVLLRRQNMAWLDLTESEADLLVPLPPRSFNVAPLGRDRRTEGQAFDNRQTSLAF